MCFSKAEDGIRDYQVTGVQTCGLPIWGRLYHETIPGFKGHYARSLDMSDRAAGTYSVVIAQNGKALARKVVKR